MEHVACAAGPGRKRGGTGARNATPAPRGGGTPTSAFVDSSDDDDEQVPPTAGANPRPAAGTARAAAAGGALGRLRLGGSLRSQVLGFSVSPIILSSLGSTTPNTLPDDYDCMFAQHWDSHWGKGWRPCHMGSGIY